MPMVNKRLPRSRSIVILIMATQSAGKVPKAVGSEAYVQFTTFVAYDAVQIHLTVMSRTCYVYSSLVGSLFCTWMMC